MSFFTEQQSAGASTGTQMERVPLEPGQYGDGYKPGLEIIMYVDSPKASRRLDNGSFRHSLLVTAIAPSREAQRVNGKAAAAHDDPASFPGNSDSTVPVGSAFMKIDLREEWLQPESVALAFDWTARYLERGGKQADLDLAAAFFRKNSTEHCIANNTPDDQLEKAVDDQYKNTMTQIRINVGKVFRLQDWGGKDWDPRADLHSLAGTHFSGRISKSDFGDGNSSEVAGIYEKKRGEKQ